MFKPTRRGFMVGCSTAIAAWTSGLSFTAFGSAEAEPNQDILIVIFLRGGVDGLNIVSPIAGDDRGLYESKRPRIAVPVTGTNAALPLDARFGLHPGAVALQGLFQDKKLAIVHAAGLTSDTRSHFDAMQFMELGTPDSKSSTTGWLTRHLQSASNLPEPDHHASGGGGQPTADFAAWQPREHRHDDAQRLQLWRALVIRRPPARGDAPAL
jgi:uncharacterized protein (DUF1501 family)